MWAKINNGNVETYPYDERLLKLDNPQVSFPDVINDELLAEWGVAVVRPSAQPEYDPLEYDCANGTPVFSGGVWTETWVISPAAPEEVEVRKANYRGQQSMTFPQLLIGLVAESWITEAEGEAWLGGVLPAAVLALISTLPPEQQFPAKARASAPSVVLRLDSLVVALGAAQGKTPEELDAFFRTYSQV